MPTPRTNPPAWPRLKPALRRVWRDGRTLQLGVDPLRAIVVGGLDEPSARLVERLDGTRDRAALDSAAATLGVGAERVSELVDVLDRAGALDDAAWDRDAASAMSPADRERLAPDLAAASLVRGGRDGGAAVLAHRRSSAVAVHGAGRIGAAVVALLAAAGVGTVLAYDAAVLRGADVTPCGPAVSDLGSRRQDAATRAARRVAPAVRARLPGDADPDLVVLTPEAPGLDQRAAALVSQGVPHLFACVRDGTGVVGPLVLPGRTSCLRCHDLHRSDRDPAWPQVAAALTRPAAAACPPCDVALATLVAAQATLQVLGHLDGEPRLLTVDGTLEIAQADGRTRRRGWSVHPLCGCGWQQG